MNLVTLPQLTAPSAADGITLTAPGVAWQNSTPFQTLIASINGAAVLTGIVVRPTFASGSNDFENEVDIATGALGAEVVIATLRFMYREIFSASATNGQNVFVLPIGIDNIPNNARVSARIRSNTTSAFTCAISIMYYSKPVSGQNTYLTTSQPLVSVPAATIGPTLTSPDGVFGNSAWVQIRAASGNALVVLGLVINGITGIFEIDLGTGTAGSEAVISTFHTNMIASLAVSGFIPLPTPLDNIAASTRIAARIRGNAIGSIRIGLIAIEKPL